MKNKMILKKSFSYLKVLLLPAVVYLLFFALSEGRFGSGNSMLTILRQCVYPALIAWSVSNIFKLGVWDFSPGSIMALSVILAVGLSKMLGLGMWGMVAIIMIACPIMTLLNFAVFNYLKIPSLISNIGMMMIYEAIACSIFQGEASIAREWTIWARAPYAYIILGVVFVFIYVLENHTKFGYDVRSLGNGNAIAKNIGVNLTRTRLKSFLLEGIILGVASIVFISYQGAIASSMNAASSTVAFSAILAVFIGIYLSRYCNQLVGIFIGAYTIKMMSSGIVSIGLSDSWQTTAIGLFLVIFLGFANNQNLIYVLIKKRKLKKETLKAQDR